MKTMGLILIQLAIFLTIHTLCSAQGYPSQSQQQSVNPKPFCRFKNKEYSPGDVWYPNPSSTQSYGAYCVICTCLATGRQNCTKQECPSDCNLDRPASLQHPCCRFCDENSDSAQSGQSGSPNLGIISSSENESGDDEEEDGDLVTENSEFVSCLHQGKIYKDGESFTANVSGLPISMVDQCMQCICQSGMVLCQMKACSTMKCNANGESTAVSSLLSPATSFNPASDTCCQKCSVWKATSKNERSENRNEYLGQRVNSRDRINDQIHRPVVGQPTGISESTVSFREQNNGMGSGNGSSTQQREKNRQNEDCISAGRFYMHGTTWHPVIGPFGTMECVVCKCNGGQIDCGRLKCQPKKDMPCAKPVKVEGHCCPICTSSINNDTPTEGSRMCVSGRQDVTAYRAQGHGINGTEFIKFGFVKLRKNAETQVDLHEWTLKDGEIIQFQTNYMTTDEFNDIKARQTFTIVGATNDKNLDKFTRREKKLEKRCLVRCNIRILSLERSLRLHKLISRRTCMPQERNVST